MADIEQAQQMIPLITCEISFGLDVSKLVFGFDVVDLVFWGPGSFDRTTNQAELCESWKQVSLWDSFL